MERTIKALRDILKGDVWVYLKDRKTCMKFYEQAEFEGFRFGKDLPTESPADDVIAIHSGKHLGHVGCYGHMKFFMCPSAHSQDHDFHRIDYAEYAAGESNFYYG